MLWLGADSPEKMKGNITPWDMPVGSVNYQTTNEPWTEHREKKKLQNLNMMSHQHSLTDHSCDTKYQLSEVLRAQMVFGSPSVQLHWQLDTLDSWMGFGCNKMPWVIGLGEGTLTTYTPEN